MLTRIICPLFLLLTVFFAQAQKSRSQANYTRLVKQGDSLYYNRNCKAALDTFRRATALVKKELYATQRVREIERYLNLPDSLKRKCTCYRQPLSVELHDKMIRKNVRLMASIDSALYARDHNKVNSLMLEADKMKIRDYVNNKRLDVEFDNLFVQRMREGDKAFAEKDYNTAKIKYQEASAIKPVSPEPTRKMAQVNDALKRQAATEEKYKQLIAEGDKAFAGKDWNTARAKYTEASTIKPTERYAQEQIAQCNGQIKMQYDEKVLQAKYDQLIAEGDKAFTAKDWITAKAKYLEALTVKPTEQYAADKIKLCEQKLKEEEKK
jgi:hypothetical protein